MTDSHAADVQAELQTYLNSKNINSLFISIVESLLIEKPANPIAFIIEYLHKQYPEEAKAALQGISEFSLGAKEETKDVDSKAEAKSPKSPSLPKKKKNYKSDDSDNEEEDYLDSVGDLMVKPSDRPVNDIRRVSVSAESVDPVHLRQQRSQLLVSEKSPEVTDRLLGVVSKSPLLRTLDEEQRDTLVRAFTGPIMKDAGDTIIQQGDIGDVFYLLEDGLVNVFVQKKGEDSKQVHTYKGGDAFGELAIMYNAPRAATCVAQNDCKLWSLDRHSYRSIVIDAAIVKRETYCGFLSRVPILQTLTEMEVMTLADALREEKYADGETVCYQGDDGDYFYIIKDGTAVCLQVDVDGDEKMVAKLHEGNYFGEIALLTPKQRQATVRAQGSLIVLALERATFTRVFGNLDEIMKRNMEEYNKYAASGI